MPAGQSVTYGGGRKLLVLRQQEPGFCFRKGLNGSTSRRRRGRINNALAINGQKALNRIGEEAVATFGH